MSPYSLLKEMLFTRWWVRVLLLLLSLTSTVFGLLSPLFQKEFVDLMIPSSAPVHMWLSLVHYFPQHPLVFMGLSFVCFIASLGLAQLTNYLCNVEANKIQRIWSQRLYDHNLKLRADSLKGKPLGEIVSVYVSDIPSATILLEQSLPQGAGIVFPLILAPIVLTTYFAIPASWIITVFVVVFCANLFLAFRQSYFFDRFKTLAADRIGIVNEWIQNIRTLRILGWVEAFEEKIFHWRAIETVNRLAMVTNGQTMNAFSSSLTFFLNIGAIGTFIFVTKQHLSPGSLLAIFWIVAFFLTKPFRMLPWFFTFVFDVWTSLKRISVILNVKNNDLTHRLDELQTLKDGRYNLKVDQLNLTIGDKKLLKNISFHIESGEFVAIVGEVGSGKTLLLLSLLGETGCLFNNYHIGENNAKHLPLDQLKQFFTFVPQEGYIMSATLRENVAFEYDVGNTIDAEVSKSLVTAQFNWKFERLENGLDTEIGERGVNLSGGQKQRVNLARVHYHSSPIILLDDCLSAVDVDTERKLVSQLLKGQWSNQTRILVTHRLSVLKEVDRILYMQHGEISAVGSFHQLLNSSPDFQKYVSSLEKESPDVQT